MSEIFKTTIGDLIEFQRGYDLPKNQFIEGKYPVVSSNGILGYHNIYKVEAPGITIGRSGTVGLPHYISERFFPHNTTLFIKDFKRNNPKYIYYLLQTLNLNDRKSGSSVPTMNRNHLHPIQIMAHLNIDIQNKIASTLSTIDDKIELNNKINDNLEKQAKLLYDYWFVQFEFPNEDGKPYKSSGGKMVYNKQLKREIPEGWEVKELGEITRTNNDSINPEQNPGYKFRYYSIPKFDETGTYEVSIGKDIKSSKFIIEDTDILVSKLNPWFSRVIFALNKSDQICSTEFVVWRTANANIKTFLFSLAKNEHFISYCTQSATGTSNSHKRVNPTIMMKYKFPFDLNLADKYGEIVNSGVNNYTSNQEQNQQLSSLRDWLLPMLMNGQVKVE